MLLRIDPIPVTFGPHDADWWMVWVTAGSVVVAGILGWLAYQNGRKAGEIAKSSAEIAKESVRIAKEAADREAARIEKEDLRRSAEALSRIALAMARALNAIEDTSRYVEDQAFLGQARMHANSLLLEAASLIDLYPQSGGFLPLRSAFVDLTIRLRALLDGASEDVERFRGHRGLALKDIGAWSRGQITADQLAIRLIRDAPVFG